MGEGGAGEGGIYQKGVRHFFSVKEGGGGVIEVYASVMIVIMSPMYLRVITHTSKHCNTHP